ncbi:MAG: hypothetical protein EAZ08_07870 [Cytophagales bacterium]|nr:MAG: hypothetical protein EAZ08_07870 [Cytophagales bacterium]
MKICLLLFFTLMLLKFPVFAQKQSLDSLSILLKTAKEDTAKVNILNKLVAGYTMAEPEKAKEYGLEGLALARRLGFANGEMVLLNSIADYWQRQGGYAKGIEYATLSLKVANQLRDATGMANAYFMLATIYTDGLKQYDLAISYSSKALEIYLAKNNKDGLANAYNLTAWILAMRKQELPLAHQYIDKSITNAKQEKNDVLLGYYLGTKGLIYHKQQKLDSALTYFKQANLFLETAQDKAIMAYYCVFIGDIYSEQEKYSEASKAYQQALTDAKKVNAKEFVKEAYRGLSELYALQKQEGKAFEYQKAYLHLKDSLLNWEINQKITVMQFEYEKEKQGIKIALLENENRLIASEKRSYLIFFTGFFLVTILVLFFIIRSSRQRNRANKLLQEKNEEIETQNEELHKTKSEIEAQNEELLQNKEEIIVQRDLLAQQNSKLVDAQDIIMRQHEESKLRNDYLEKVVGERTQELKITVQNLLKRNQDLEQFSYIISHNLRSPVARIQGLVNIFNQENMNDTFNKQVLTHLHQSANGLDTVIRDLTEIVAIRKSFNTNAELVNIKELVNNELMSLETEIKRANAVIEIDLNVTSIYSIRAYMQSIFHNLLSNAIKYRHTYRQPLIIIRTTKDDDNFCLQVQDNGLGVDVTDLYKIFGLYQRMHTHVEGKGLGLYLVKTQVEAMNGRIEIESLPNHGSVFKVYLPV